MRGPGGGPGGGGGAGGKGGLSETARSPNPLLEEAKLHRETFQRFTQRRGRESSREANYGILNPKTLF